MPTMSHSQKTQTIQEKNRKRGALLFANPMEFEMFSEKYLEKTIPGKLSPRRTVPRGGLFRPRETRQTETEGKKEKIAE